MEPSEYHTMAQVEERHWWYRGMAAITLRLLPQVLRGGDGTSGGLRILDAGCGTGLMLYQMSPYGRCFGTDIHPLALAYSRDHASVVQSSVDHLPFADGSFDLTTSFDVLCHRSIPDDVAALREFARVLRPGGGLILRLPALESLRGSHDEFVHTSRRYTSAGLREKLTAAGLQPLRLTFANTLLFLPIYVRRRLQQLFRSDAPPASDVSLPAPLVNVLLEGVLRLEGLCLSRFNLPFGVTLVALARKEKDQTETTGK